MITVTQDPISMNEVKNLDTAPCLIEGNGPNALKIYFESEANLAEYQGIETHGSCNSSGLKQIFNDIADCPITGSIN